MATNKKREATDYAVEKVVDAIKVIEALEGANFEPVTIPQIIERVGYIPGRGEKLKPDAVRRILITLKLVGWAAKSADGKWTIGNGLIRFANIVGKHNF